MKKAKNEQNLTPFKPGQSGNPNGRPKTPEWLQGVKLLPKHVAAILWSKWLSMDATELKAFSDNYKNSNLSAIELGMCRAIQGDIERGEMKNIEIGLSRIIGRISDQPPNASDTGLQELTPEELMNRVKNALAVMEEKKND